MPPLLLPRHHLRMTARQPQWRAPALKIASARRAALAPARGPVGIDDDRAHAKDRERASAQRCGSGSARRVETEGDRITGTAAVGR